jgi:hypothetical protein
MTCREAHFTLTAKRPVFGDERCIQARDVLTLAAEVRSAACGYRTPLLALRPAGVAAWRPPGRLRAARKIAYRGSRAALRFADQAPWRARRLPRMRRGDLLGNRAQEREADSG